MGTELTLHPDLESIAFLLGAWRGKGEGEYPTIESFTYEEEVRFAHRGKPFLAYVQRTWAPDGTPRHAEAGYWRPVPPDGVELVMAHPTGIAEIEVGRVSGRRIELATTNVTATPTAKQVTRLERTIEVDGDVLRYTLRMAAVGHELTHHLAAELHRIED